MGIPDIWKVLAGVAIFLLGVRFLEESLQLLAGRPFKLFLKKHTSNKLKGIGGGALVTAILQSSSVVSLMVLAFVGAGIITMSNALAVILGANLGTTITGWFVSLAGFTFNIEGLALPVAAVAGLGYAVFNRHGKWYNWSRFFLGLSFLFIGLGYMKTGMEGFVTAVNLREYTEAPLVLFLVIGFLITSLIQSSSATMAITLSALFTGAITLVDGIAVMLGSEIGTTIKLFFASFGGSAAKKRVALGNFLFNSITSILVLSFLVPLSRLVTENFGIRESTIALVFFQTMVNILGIILFYPFLGIFGRFLDRLYRKDEEESMYIHEADARVPSGALVALEKECDHFLNTVLDFTWSSYGIKNPFEGRMEFHSSFRGMSPPEKYERIKALYGEIHGFNIRVQKGVALKEETEKMDRLVSAFRNFMYAAKSIKDSVPDMEQLEKSSNDTKFGFYRQTQERVGQFCSHLYELKTREAAPTVEKLAELYTSVTRGYNDVLRQFFMESIAGQLSETEITTLLNFNREIYTAFKSFVFGVKDLLFDRQQSHYFEELPGFIR